TPITNAPAMAGTATAVLLNDTVYAIVVGEGTGTDGIVKLGPEGIRELTDAYRRAGVAGPDALDGAEVHDCFTITEYVALDHLGLTPPGESWRAIEDGTIAPGGRFPVNPSGGLIGQGHPVGASGVRMILDAARQVEGAAGDYQVPGARRFATLNIGGSATTACAFVVARGS
ncbi:MAG: thiolase domain-containing protein, partial [Deltaproteobacteria bacterium]|nr:thiolase domain-containing protein [Kofleriaceae bacterium]